MFICWSRWNAKKRPRIHRSTPPRSSVRLQVEQLESRLVPTATPLMTVIPEPAIYGQSEKVDVSVAGSSGTPTGTVVAVVDAAASIMGTLDAVGNAQLNLGNLPAGSHSVDVIYSGDGTYGGTQFSASFTVNPAPLTISAIPDTKTYDGTTSSSQTPIYALVPAITSSRTSTATLGSSFFYQVTATGEPTSFSASGLPSGLSINSATGVISGSIHFIGSVSVTISAANIGGTDTETLMLTIMAESPSLSTVFLRKVY